MTTKFIESKLCKECEKIHHFKNFRKIKANKTGQKKGRFQGWTDSEGGKMEIAKLFSNDNNYSPSFDRIDPKKGYTKNNIVIVSTRANRIKSDATVDEIRKVADFYEKLLKDK